MLGAIRHVTFQAVGALVECGRQIYRFGVASSTRTRYAKSGGVDVAYQVLGDGPIDLLVFTGWMLPIDCLDEEPAMVWVPETRFVAFNARSSRRRCACGGERGRVEVDAFEIGWPWWLVRLLVGTR